MEIHLDAYKSSKICKERMKKEKFINRRELWEGDLVRLFTSRLKIFSGKLHSRWSGPFRVLKVYLYGAIEIGVEATSLAFKVNGSRLKHYIAGKPIEGKVTYALLDALST